MDISILNNVKNIPAVQNFLNAQEEDSMINDNTWFGSLEGAQRKSNEYMAANKERIPMVIEYLSGPAGGISGSAASNSTVASNLLGSLTSKTSSSGGNFASIGAGIATSALTVGGETYTPDTTGEFSLGTPGYSVGGGFGGGLSGLGGTSVSKDSGTDSNSTIQAAAQTNTSSTTEQSGNRISVTLYINPNRINMSTQKIISKAITRGGIFYNHWGDDNWQMSLAGSCGLAGMKYIQKLEQIYQMSGVLLAYGENSQGAVYTSCENSLFGSIASGDYAGAIGALMNGGVSGLGKALRKGVKGALAAAITGKGTAALRSSTVFSKLAVVMGAGIEKVNDALAKYGKISIGGSGDTSVLGTLGGSMLGNIISGKLGLSGDSSSSGSYRPENVVDFDTASTAWADIADELEDPWRPRQVWIYFEDRVYIGHFNSFSYQRVAETMNINYEMKFTVIRMIIVTSYSPTLPGFVPAQKTVEPSTSMSDIAKIIAESQTGASVEDKLATYAQQNAAGQRAAKLAILDAKETYSYEKNLAIDNGSTISDARTKQLAELTAKIRAVAGISDNDELLGVQELSSTQRLVFYNYANKDNADGTDNKATTAVNKELLRIKAKAQKLKSNNQLNSATQDEMWAWVQLIHGATGRTSYDTWEKQLMPS
jgi:hypothetical protein